MEARVLRGSVDAGSIAIQPLGDCSIGIVIIRIHGGIAHHLAAAGRAAEGSKAEHRPGGQIVLAGHAMMGLFCTDPAPAPEAG